MNLAHALAQTFLIDTGLIDTGLVDTGSIDTGSLDTFPIDARNDTRCGAAAVTPRSPGDI
jgi:hypothetical protein